MKKRISKLLSAVLVLCMVPALLPGAVLAAGANYDTIRIYVENRNVWTDSSDWLFFENSYHYGLIDLEGDGIPELFLSGRGGTGLTSQNHYYKVDAGTRSVYEMRNLPAELESLDLLSGIEIYKDTQGRLFYYSSDALRRGWQYSSAWDGVFYMQNGVVFVKPLRFWECNTDNVNYTEHYTYYYYTDSGDLVETSESDWNQYLGNYFSQYTHIAGQVPTHEALEMNRANDADLEVILRGMYDKLYQSLGVPVVQLSTQKLTVNGNDIDCEKYNIDGYNYFKLRDLAYLLNGTGSRFEVGYDTAANAATVTTGKPYTGDTALTPGVDNSASAQRSTQKIIINGKEQELTAYNIGGYNFFQLRELGDLLNFEVGYDAATNTAIVTGAKK